MGAGDEEATGGTHTSQHDLSHLPTTVIKKTELTVKGALFCFLMEETSQQEIMVNKNFPIIFSGLPSS